MEGRVASAARPSRVVALAPWIFAVLWSTGFVAARYATADTGPLTFLAARMVLAAAALAFFAAVRSATRVDRTLVPWVVLAGIGMHVLYLGGVFVAIDHGLPAGVSALIAGLHPVLTALASRRVLGERLIRIQWIGVALGFAGVTAVVIDRMLTHSSGVTAITMGASAVSVLGMAGGTLVQRKKCSTMPLLWGTVIQYAGAGVVLLVLAAAWEHIDFRITSRSVFALLWAVVVLSIAAVLLLLWLLQRRAASQVTSLFFLTPALSAVEGAILFGERLGVLALVGLAISLLGVAFVTRKAI
ncbi:MAG: DMT family transporter [Ilumatobacteraceae bacterium]